MLFEAGLEVMILNLELLALFGFKAFFYDRKRKRFIRLDRDHKLKIILTSGTVATLVINGIHTMAFSKGLTSTKKAFIGTFVLGFWTAYLVTMPVLIGCQRYVDLLNMMRFFESGYFKQIGKFRYILAVGNVFNFGREITLYANLLLRSAKSADRHDYRL